MVRGSRVTISCGFKVEFCVEKQFRGVFAWSANSTDKCIVTFFNVVVGPGHRTVSRAATCWAGRYPGPTISVTFASVFKTGQYWHGCA